MRPIKFRAWDKKEKRIYPVFKLLIDEYKGVRGVELLHAYSEYQDIDEVKLMQYTGLKDKNGKEIWESDLVRYAGREVYDSGDGSKYFLPKGVYKVTLEGWGGHIEMQDYFLAFGLTRAVDLEVIGNIYENPDLLEKKR